jgi:hypothetical protein
MNDKKTRYAHTPKKERRVPGTQPTEAERERGEQSMSSSTAKGLASANSKDVLIWLCAERQLETTGTKPILAKRLNGWVGHLVVILWQF